MPSPHDLVEVVESAETKSSTTSCIASFERPPILFLSNVYPNPLQSGKGIFNFEMLRGLSKHFDISVVSPVSWLDELRSNRSAQFRPERFERREGIMAHYPRYYYPPGIWRASYAACMWKSIRATLESVVARSRPVAIMSYWTHPDGAVALRMARRIGVPCISMVGGSDVLVNSYVRSRRRGILRVLRHTDAVVVVSEHLRGAIIDLGISEQKVHVLYRGVDQNRFHPDDKQLARRRLGLSSHKRLVLWAGRMAQVKGLDTLLAAFAALAKRRADVDLLLVGDGELRSRVERQIVSQQIEDRVHQVGQVSHGELADWYRSADLTVLTSSSEGVPNVLLESIACGTPFVASAVGGIPEIATPGLDRLVQAGDVDGFCQAMADSLGSAIGRSERKFFPQGLADSADSLCRLVQSVTSPQRLSAIADPVFDQRRVCRRSPSRQFVRRALTNLVSRNILIERGPQTTRKVCLTFDDGPTCDSTPALLELLERQQVSATFFLIGRNAAANPNLVREIDAAGHEIGNHSYDHLSALQTSMRRCVEDWQKGADVLTNILGKKPKLFRPPYGKVSPAVLFHCWRDGATTVLWSLDPKDWATEQPADLRQFLDAHPPRRGEIMLFHDTSCRHFATIAHLIESMRRQGLEFGTISDWINA